VHPVVELRRYALHPGTRETLIDVFDGHLVEPQEAAGMQVLGQFRDLDDPDAFVWLRGFPDVAERGEALRGFYGGPAWDEHSAVANPTMVSFDDVLLLSPVDTLRPSEGVGRYAIVIHPAAAAPEPPDDAIGVWQTDRSPNDFPQLPIREDADVVVWLAPLAGDEAERWPGAEVLRLEPTARSRLS